jgi:hypothetical protein
MSTFKVAGVSSNNGEMKVRFANDMVRVKILTKYDHKDINLIELPKAMTKPNAVKFLLTTEMAKNPKIRAVLDEADEKYSGTKVVKAEKKTALKTGSKSNVVAKKTTAPKVTQNKKIVQDPTAALAALASRVPSANNEKNTEKNETADNAVNTDEMISE